MRRLQEALGIILVCIFAMPGLVLVGATGAWAQAGHCTATVEVEQGSTEVLQDVAHCMLKKRYPYLVGQIGAEVSMTSLQSVKKVRRLAEEAKGKMIGLLMFEVETTGGTSKKLGLNGSTFLVGLGAGGELRIPFAKIKTVTISCP